MDKMLKFFKDSFEYEVKGARYNYRGYVIYKNFSTKNTAPWYWHEDGKVRTNYTLKTIRREVDRLVDCNSINFITE